MGPILPIQIKIVPYYYSSYNHQSLYLIYNDLLQLMCQILMNYILFLLQIVLHRFFYQFGWSWGGCLLGACPWLQIVAGVLAEREGVVEFWDVARAEEQRLSRERRASVP